jgi:hypothetical protein
MKMKYLIAAVSLALALPPALAWAQNQPPKYSAKVPPSITTPDNVQTRIGTLKFSDGLPDADTVQKVYDQLDFGRGVEAFMAGMPAASVQALKEGFTRQGFGPNQGIGITETLSDARQLFLTANATTVYLWFCVDVKDGPMVVQVPPGVLGIIDDAFFRYVTDLGVPGPDQGKGGKYLVVPPGFKGKLPGKGEGYFVNNSRTYNHLVIIRAFVQGGDVAAAVKNVKNHARVYPLSAASNPPQQKFVNISGKQFNTVHANDFLFYEELNAVIQHEPADFITPDQAGLFAAIGIKKGTPFEPDARMKAILTDAAAVANAASRSILFNPRDPRTKVFPDRQWLTPFVTASHEFADRGERTLDARTMFHYYATGVTPAMVAARPGVGSAYAIAGRDSQGRYFDGSKTYKITLPANVPAARFWSFTIYDNQTRSMLETDQASAGLDSTFPGVKPNADGTITVWFSPKPPAGQEGNWVQTQPGKGWNTLFRLYGPLEPWFKRTWKPGDFELVQ